MSVQTSVNPATGDIIRQYPEHTAAEVQEIIANAHACYLEWKKVPVANRATMLNAVSHVLQRDKDKYSRLISTEMGKPLKEAVAEIDKCASTARYFAENAAKFLADEHVVTEYRKSFVTYQPIGIILGVMPWNFPFWQVFRFALPSLVAGNVGLLKHASNTPGCALAIAEVFKSAGFPEHAFQALLIPGKRAEEVIGDKRVAAVTLTGSTPAGRSVAALAGKHLKKTVLELGGSDAYLVLEDADLDHAIKICAAARLLNSGQSCVSAKRMIVAASLKERFEKGVLEIFKAQKQGDPLDPASTMGPMSRADLRDELHEQVERSIRGGAKCLTGGKIPEGRGAFYPPTVLTDVKKGTTAYDEEMFGPVAVIITAKDEADALRIANDTPFGLGGAVFTTDLARGEAIAREGVESGACFVNMQVRSDARLPFGGVKESGYGRELAAFGLREFVNIKSIVIA